MLQRFDKVLRFLTSLVFSLSALGFLLSPVRMQEITAGIPTTIVIGLSIACFVLAIFNETAIAVQFEPRKRKFLNLFSIIFLVSLSYLYLKSRLYVEGLLPFSISLGFLFLLLEGKIKLAGKHDLILTSLTAFNFFCGGAFIALADNALYRGLGSYPVLIGVLSIGTAVAGGYAAYRPGKFAGKFITKIMALPWILWSLVFAIEIRLPSLLTAFCLAIFILLLDMVPWKHLSLPANDILGRRAIYLAGTAEILMLLALAGILGLTSGTPQSLSQTRQITGHEIAFLTMLTTKVFFTYGLAVVILTINNLTAQLSDSEFDPGTDYQNSPYLGWSQWIARSLKPFASPSKNLRTRLEIQSEQIAALSHQLAHEKRRTGQLNLLAELSQQLEAQLDQPVTAQLAVNTLQKALNCSEVTIYENELERREFSVLASAGDTIPTGYRQNTAKGLLGRALRLRKTQIAHDTSLDPDFIPLETSEAQSVFAVPLIYHGHVKAVLEVGDKNANAFSSTDIYLAERVAAEVVRAWERSSYHQRLTNLIKAGISLSPLLEPHATIQEIATIARETLLARFSFVTLLDQEGNFSRTAYSGNTQKLLSSLDRNPVDDPTIQAALHAHEPFRIRDVRKYSRSSHIDIDHNGLRSLLAIPIRLHRLSIGAILAFGKQGEIFFSENDESLASLLASQAAAAIEATWLYQELRNTLNTTTQLYNLSVNIIRAEELSLAARHIAEIATKVSNATAAGIVLFSKDHKIEAEIEVDEDGAHPGKRHPMELIEQTLQSGQVVHVTPDQVAAIICFPLQTPLRKYGALWLDIPKIRDYFARHAPNMQTLANQATLALERSILLVEYQQQANALKEAYQELEFTYDRTLAALMSALDARDRETEGHSSRVSVFACRLGQAMNLNGTLLKALERGSLLHDIGKIGISDTILHKPAALSSDEWKIMRLHPDIGARIVEDIPFLQDTLPVIRYHHERWNGSGYPVGLSGKDIPKLARIFAVADAFDALISDRPYRRKISVEEALRYLQQQAGILFDPEIVTVFERLAKENRLGTLEI